MDWKISFFTVSIGIIGSLGEPPNLAWELIEGFMHIWNYTNQGICIALPDSISEGFKFTLIWVNFWGILTKKLDNLNKTEGNATWRVVKFHFLDLKEGQQWVRNGTWTKHGRSLYQIPSNSTWNYLWNQTCYWTLIVNSTIMQENTTSIPCTIVPW